MKHVLMLTGITIWIIENMYYGWNLRPENGWELFWDYIASGFVIWAVAIAVNEHIQYMRFLLKEMKEQVEKLKELNK